MGSKMSLPDIHFADKDPKVIEAEIIAAYTNASGRELASADPIMTLFKVFTAQITGLRNSIDKAGRMNLLATTEDEYLDEFVKDFNLVRKQAVSASVTVRFTLTQAQLKDIVIPKGTLVTAGDKIFFGVPENTTIKAGSTFMDIVCVCTTGGAVGNNYLPGTINQQFQPQQFIGGVLNLDISSGGIDAESDDSLKQRRLVAPEALSTAGPDKGYIFFARNATPAVIDVEPYSPTPGVVQLIPLMTDGRFPTPAELELIQKACSPSDKRPLTDKVESISPASVNYTIDLTYWISSKASVDIEQIQANVTKTVNEFIFLTKTKLGRAINPSLLEQMLMNAGVRRVEIRNPKQQELTCLQVGNNIANKVEFGGIEKDY